MFKYLLVTLAVLGMSGCNPHAEPRTSEVKNEVIKRFKVQQVYTNSIAYIVTDKLTGCEYMKLDDNGGPVLLRCEDSLKEKH